MHAEGPSSHSINFERADIKAGAICDEPVSTLDLSAAFCDYANTSSWLLLAANLYVLC